MSRSAANVVISGMGMVTCLGADVRSTWRGVLDGRGGFGALTALDSVEPVDAAEPQHCLGCQCEGAIDDPTDEAPREVRLLGAALREAWHEAFQSSDPPYPAHRCGYVLGTTLHGMRQGGRFLRTGDHRFFADFLAGATLRRAALGMYPRGPMLTTCSACSSGLGSIALALTLLRSGELDVVAAGGYDPISEYAYAGFKSLRLVAAGRSRPFTKARDGLNIGEGYAVVILELADAAAARGVRESGASWVRGLGESSDAHHLTQPHPEGAGASRAIRAALDHARVEPSDIGLISAHATGTPNNDGAESAALAAVFGQSLSRVPVVAFKTHIGHTLGGAGAAELILAAVALHEQVIPPAAASPPDGARELEFPAIQLNNGPARRASFDTTLNLSLGFGGANSCAILARSPELPDRRAAPSDAGPREVFVTGVGIILPGAVGNDEFAALLAATEVGLEAPPRSGTVAEDRYAHLIHARRLRRMSDYVKLTLGATVIAFTDAHIPDIPIFAEGCSALLGTTHGSTGYCEAYYSQVVKEGIAAANPLLFAEGVPNAAAAQMSMMFQIKGSCQTLIGSRTAGLDALRMAALRISTGEWERAIVSAGEEHSALVDEAYRAHGLLSAGDPGKAMVDRRGFTTGAGAASFVLESRASIEGRGCTVDQVARGRIVASAARSCPRLLGREGIERVRGCLEQIETPSHIFSSANATWLDRVEAAGIGASRRGLEPAIVSAMHGHMAETFSVGPLAGIAGVLVADSFEILGAGGEARGVFPPLRSPWTGNARGALPSRGGTTTDFGVLATDYAGLISAMSVRYLNGRSHRGGADPHPRQTELVVS